MGKLINGFLFAGLFFLTACGAETNTEPETDSQQVPDIELDTDEVIEPEIDLECAEQAQIFLEDIQPILEKWDDAIQLADTTSRIALSGPISELQAIKRDTNALQAHECVSKAKEALVSHMEITIDGFMMFMSEETETDIKLTFREAQKKLEQFGTNLNEAMGLPTATPYPTPRGTRIGPLPTKWSGRAFCDNCSEILLWDSPAENQVTGTTIPGRGVTVFDSQEYLGTVYYYVRSHSQWGWVDSLFVTEE